MKGLPALVLTYVLNILAVASTDDAPGIYCNLVPQTWHEAVEDCKDKRGDLVSFQTGIGKKIDELPLKGDIDVWTADYAWKPENGFSSAPYEKLCGIDYLNSTLLFPTEELYGYCDEIRNYLCKDTTSTCKTYL
ncbi:uncharacterized protein LOC128559281 [Mercenaria mercenaria]|uniref:uncharacterized protein LOC128559281 n=1 Tax=Mercenaria mercenaria TaxID=6596 RepID=UPI00234F38BB|nr:uncharacterized protein LOC128559281 [Mercenaria mercenaria]